MDRRRRIPLWLKLAYTLFLGVLVPVYWRNYGPQNFLFLCDVALFVTLAALWLESPLLAGSQAVALLLPQSIWVFDFVSGLVTGTPAVGVTGYMFDPGRSLLLRGLSLFHGWLPLLLVYLVWRLGYDRRALLVETVLAWVVLLLCYLFTDPPPPPSDDPNKAVNVNYVFGFPTDVQTTMHPVLWLLSLMAFHPVCIYLPTHLVLLRLARKPPRILTTKAV